MKSVNKNELIECIDNKLNEYGLTISQFNEYKTTQAECFHGYKAVFPKNQTITYSGNKSYVDNLKVMLAQELYKGKTTIKLTDSLSKTLKIDDPPIGWYVSEKWDGIRALWDGEKFISRGSTSGKPKVYTYVPDWFKFIMPPGISLDGEIWIARGQFSKVVGLSNRVVKDEKSKKMIDTLWSGTKDIPGVIYKVFDIPGNTAPFEERMKFLQLIIRDRTTCWKGLKYDNKGTKCPLQFSNQTKIQSMEQLINIYNEITSKGAEGVMLRAPGSPYELKRSKYLLKYKIKEDSEAIVREYLEGSGRLKRLLGALRCELVINGKPSGVMFNIGTGFSDEQRTEYKNEKSNHFIPIGSIVSFSYMELSKDSIPRHPVYRGVREDFSLNTQTLDNKSKDIPDDINNIIINAFNVMIATTEANKEPNWQFKRKSYVQANNIIINADKINSMEKAIEILRNGGMKLTGEETYYKKNNEWKSKLLEKIDEILTTGTLSAADKYSQDPKVIAVEELSKIPEIGPAAAIKFYDSGITNIPALRAAYEKDNNILNDKQVLGLKYHEDLLERIPKDEMIKWNTFFHELFINTIKDMKNKPVNSKLQLVGSYRRGAESSGDIDILISSDTLPRQLMTNYTLNLLKTDKTNTDLVFSSGTTKFMGLGKIDKYYRHIDIFYYSKDEFPFALLFSTGSGQFNMEMRALSLKKGFSLSDKGIRHKTSKGTVISTNEYLEKIGKEKPENEEDIFKFLDFPYIEPSDRKSGILK